MSLLILGADGLIGGEFVRCCRQAGIPFQGTAFARPEPDWLRLDIRQPGALPSLLDELAPQAVVNAIGLAGGVDLCERQPELGRLFHVETTRILADWCRRRGAALLFLSTDYVFDGRRPRCREEDEPRPLNLYGELKLQAERLIQERLERAVIARTTQVYGWDPGTATPNFLMQILLALQQTGRAAAPAYLFGNPTLAADLAAAMLDLWRNGRFGLYHIVGPSHVSRLEWAQQLAAELGLGREAVTPLPQPPPGAVPRPLKLELVTDKLRRASGVELHDMASGTRRFAADARAGGGATP